MFNNDNVNGKNEFLNRLNTFKESIIKYKNIKNIYWCKDFDEIESKLNNITIKSRFDFQEAKNDFDNLQCTKSLTFENYVKNISDGELYQKLKGPINRSKTLRAKRKDNKCPNCNIELDFDNRYYCKLCGYELNVKSSSIPNKPTVSNNVKHITKQLESLCGVKKLPATVEKIKEYIALWLTDLQYLGKWLKSNELLYSKFSKKYRDICYENLKDEWFNTKIERNEDNMWEFKLYKIIIDEFYSLLEYVYSLSKIQISNINSLEDNVKINVVKEWVNKNNNKIPEMNDIIIYNNEKYEIGFYFVELKLLYRYDENHIKNTILKLFNFTEDNILIPGLMFNFKELFKLSDAIPRKFAFSQEFVGICHYVFNVPFVNITPFDIEKITDIMMRFNQYYKKVNFKNSDTKNNSPLFTCTIQCVITKLDYFNKYQQILKYIPNKYKGTSTSDLINKYWISFIMENKAYIDKFRNVDIQKNDEQTEINNIIEFNENNIVYNDSFHIPKSKNRNYKQNTETILNNIYVNDVNDCIF